MNLPDMNLPDMTFHSLLGALLLLIVGVLQLALFNRLLYPALRWRHEKAKLTQEHGMEPNRITMLVKIQSLIILPLLGLFLGTPLKSILG
jgi:hypothetical protein